MSNTGNGAPSEPRDKRHQPFPTEKFPYTPHVTTKQFSASELEAKLWGGFAEYAVPKLERLKSNGLAPPNERQSAAWSLTRWFYVEGDYERALENIQLARRLSRSYQAHFTLAEGQCLVKLKRWRAANKVLKQGARRSREPDFQLLRSTVVYQLELERGGSRDHADTAKLHLLNKLYLSAKLSPLKKTRQQDPLQLSNITAPAEPRSGPQNLKVSIIIPAYNAGTTLNWAIESLLQQTWRNLELLVVDDCSTDDTRDVVAHIASRDPRIRLIALKENSGAYAARNAGLPYASGDLITVHDSDDWSHPQRIELQVQSLQSDPGIVATKSYWVRVGEGLDVVGAWIPKGSLIDLNYTSLLFRREVLDVIGTWDEVVVSGDNEFYSRLKQLYGSQAVLKLPRDKILAFSLTRDDSLTRSDATHLRTLHYGLRRNYRDSYRYWHSQLSFNNSSLPFEPAKARRPFPVPPRNRPRDKRHDCKYNIVVFSDFAIRGEPFISALSYVVAASRAGMKVGVFHWRTFALDADTSPDPRLYDACVQFDVDILDPGDRVEADVVLIGYPASLQYKVYPPPHIRTQHLVTIVNYAGSLLKEQDRWYEPQQVRRHLQSIFGTEGVWVAASIRVKRMMERDRRFPIPFATPWPPIVDVDPSCRAAVRWRGGDRRVPVVGSHGCDTHVGWPSDPEALARAHGVGQDWELRIRGSAEYAIGILRGCPVNWRILPLCAHSTAEFLQELDFYVTYPQEQHIEEFVREAMDAMALGVPVVLPPEFEETFGGAATYALATDVPDVVSELWRSPDTYLRRAEAGRQFVLQNCSVTRFPDRLEDLLETVGRQRSSM